MKKSVIFFASMILSVAVFGQNVTKQISVDVDEVQVTPPKFTGMQNATESFNARESSKINNYVLENFVCPEGVVKCKLEGTEIIEFTVNPDGKLSNFKVINSVCRKVDEEMIKVLRTTNGMWMPGNNNGVPTAMEKELSMMIGDYSPDEIVNHFVRLAEKYFEIGSTNLLVEQKLKKALRYYDKGVRYMPNDKSLLLMRGICNYGLGNREKAEKDWNRIVSLGGFDYHVDFDSLTEMKGYSEMRNILAKNQDK